MMISLILCTLNRDKELYAFLRSLENQDFNDYEVILIDQNPQDFLDLKQFSTLNIQHFNVDFKGLSKARNYGLEKASGDLIAFPDDDCYYPPNTLSVVNQFFSEHDASALAGAENSQEDMSQILGQKLNWNKNDLSKINLLGSFTGAISFVLFFTKDIVKKTGKFDENIGVGAGTKWGSGEETDFLIRVLKNGGIAYRNNTLGIFHPKPKFDKNLYKKANAYGLGRNYIIKKHKIGFLFILVNVLHSLLRMVISFPNRDKMIFFYQMALGRLGIQINKPPSK